MNTTATLRRSGAISDRINPRRRYFAQLLLAYARWHGRKITVDADTYSNIHHEHGMDPYQVDAAADDLHYLGCARIEANGRPDSSYRLIIIDPDIDRLAGGAA